MVTRKQLDAILEAAGEMQTGKQTQVNQTRDHLPTPQTDAAYAWLRTNAKPLWYYITYDAPIPIDPVGSMEYVKRYGLDTAMDFINSALKKDTKAIWGGDHPSLQDDPY